MIQPINASIIKSRSGMVTGLGALSEGIFSITSRPRLVTARALRPAPGVRGELAVVPLYPPLSR